MQLDLTKEDPVALEEVGARFRVTLPTVWRWALRGLPGPDGRRVRLRERRDFAPGIARFEGRRDVIEIRAGRFFLHAGRGGWSGLGDGFRRR